MKFITTTPFVVTFLFNSAIAGELKYTFKDPSFSGDSTWSTHVLTIENEEYQRKQAIQQQKEAAAAAALAMKNNTPLNQFIMNLQTRIYAQISQQLANNMFSGNGAGFGSFDFEGTHIDWRNSGNTIIMDIRDPSGNLTEIRIPIGSFAF